MNCFTCTLQVVIYLLNVITFLDHNHCKFLYNYMVINQPIQHFGINPFLREMNKHLTVHKM